MRGGVFVLLLFALGSAGCSFGPRAIEKTHSRYAQAVQRVDQEQLLKQMVLMKYHEFSFNLDLTNIAAQYELSGSAEAKPFFEAPNPASGSVFKTFTTILPDLSIGGVNRPTVSMTPMNDGSSVRRHLTPITLDILVFLTQTSFPASDILRLWVDRINGIPNAAVAIGSDRDMAPDYERFLYIVGLLRTAQAQDLAQVKTEEYSHDLGGPFEAESITPALALEAVKNNLTYESRDEGKTFMLVRKERRLVVALSPGAEKSPEITELAKAINLVPGQQSYELVLQSNGAVDPLKVPLPPDRNIRVVPRSTAQVMMFLANGVEVPSEHYCAGLVIPMQDAAGQPFDPRVITQDLFQVHVCKGGHHPPEQAYLAIRYRDYWFYIDDRDTNSKSTFMLVYQLSRLDFARQQLGGTNAPTLTLPVGR